MVAGCGGGGTATGQTTSTSITPPKRGGTFRLGTSDGSTADTLDSLQGDNGYTNIVRAQALYDILVKTDDKTGLVANWLAESLEPAPDLSYWTVRVRPAEFHDGKPVTADDVIYTLRRVLNPKSGAFDASLCGAIDPNRMQKLDSRTVRLHLHYPDISVPYALRNQGCSIVPVGYDPKNPIGSGPFKYMSFTPGQQSVFVRNDNYWQSGKPYLDELQIVDFADPGTTRINALTSGQIDGADHIQTSLAPTVEAASGVKLINSISYGYHTWEMRMDVPPFDDVRVRQAMKLIAGRPQIVDQAFSGTRFATVANDWPSFQDPMYNHSIPQRVQDLEQARSLLKQAGRDGMTVELVVSPVSPGVVQTAQVLAQQAQAAGVTIKVTNVSDGATYYSKYAAQAPFKFDYFNTESVWEHILYSLLPTSPSYYTAWKDPEWSKLFSKARATPDAATRKALMGEAQKIFWERGTQGVFDFYYSVDAYSTKFTGFKPSMGGMGLNGMFFQDVGLA
jgi:peptide/nickel transport system substrate-binding protein